MTSSSWTAASCRWRRCSSLSSLASNRPSTPRGRSRQRTEPRWSLALDTVRTHRASVLAWAVGGALAMWVQALAIATEMDSFPGGARAVAQSMVASTEAMRPLRWPAARLDTLGGYLTFHNVPLFNLSLAI